MTKMSAAELRAALEKAERAEEQERNRRLEATPVIHRYTVTPTPRRNTWDRIWDDTIVLYRIEAHAVNAEEAKAAGHRDLHEGGMTYLYNTGTGKLITATGGGLLVISTFYDEHRAAEDEARAKVSDFLVTHPEGGDITDIVQDFNAKTGKSW